MHRLAKLGTLLLLLVAYVAPAMACAIPDAHMTQQERVCCRMMKNDCGHMQMTTGHECCQKLPSSLDLQAIQATPANIHPTTMAAVWLPATQPLYPSSISIPGKWTPRTSWSRPESPPLSISILRI